MESSKILKNPGENPKIIPRIPQNPERILERIHRRISLRILERILTKKEYPKILKNPQKSSQESSRILGEKRKRKKMVEQWKRRIRPEEPLRCKCKPTEKTPLSNAGDTARWHWGRTAQGGGRSQGAREENGVWGGGEEGVGGVG